MSHSASFRKLMRAIGIARFCEEKKISTSEGLERIAALEARVAAQRTSRREFLASTGKLAVLGALGSVVAPFRPAQAGHKPHGSALAGTNRKQIAIVGAGLAGLACADRMKARGTNADIFLYEANDKAGGRCRSLGGDFSVPGFAGFPGQVVERGGEFIGPDHTTMLGYLSRFGLTKEDCMINPPGKLTYVFPDAKSVMRPYTETEVLDNFRALVKLMGTDLKAVSWPVTPTRHSAAEAALDNTTLREYLDRFKDKTPLACKAVEQAFIAEYGREIAEQSSLNFVLTVDWDKGITSRPVGVFPDDQYHVVNGNEKIVRGLGDQFPLGSGPGQTQYGMKLTQAYKDAAGKIVLTFKGYENDPRTYDAVVFAIPFSTLRNVALDVSLGLGDQANPDADKTKKMYAICKLGYGNNAKMMVGFKNSNSWRKLGYSGESYSGLPNHQNTWESNPTKAMLKDSSGKDISYSVLTDYSGGTRGLNLGGIDLQKAADDFLQDLDKVFPGGGGYPKASLAAFGTAVNRDRVVYREHWPSNEFSLGSYTCNQKGYFTEMADTEGTPVGNLFFAGEHTSSWWEFQGFMEGAAVTGIKAADAIAQAISAGTV